MRGEFRAAATVGLAALGVVAAGTVGYILLEGATPLDAFYMTVITVTTIGYREVFPLSPAGKIFTIVLAVAGVGVMLLAVTEAASVMVTKGVQRFLGLRRARMKRMKRHVVVCGYGRIGRAVVETLRKAGVPYLVVESDPEICLRLASEGIPVVQGDATKLEVLEEAGVRKAENMIVCLDEDAHALLSVLVAKELNPNLNIVARAMEEDTEERLRRAGADRVVNPYRIGGLRLAYSALKPGVVDFLEQTLGGLAGELELAEVVVRAGGAICGKSLADAELRSRFGVLVVALRRGERGWFNPDPTTKIEEGDVLVVLGKAGDIERLEAASVGSGGAGAGRA